MGCFGHTSWKKEFFMCTAINLTTKDHYFGRNLDLEYFYEETVTITPRNYPFLFRKMGRLDYHYAMIGMAYVVDGYPLYYDATNEKGVSIAGLRFAGNAVYQEELEEKENISPFELIPWILSQCATMAEVKQVISRLNLVSIAFSEQLPLTPLHWMISYKEQSMVLECTKDGLQIYENKVNVLTNNPPFELQMWNLSNYMGLSKDSQENRFSKKLELEEYSRGMGAIGLPGDLSSASRFVRGAFVLQNSISAESEEESVGQFFHVLGSVEQQRGCVKLGENKYEVSVYSSCCNTTKGIYYYVTYTNRQITAINMWKEDIESDIVVMYPLIKKQQIYMQN